MSSYEETTLEIHPEDTRVCALVEDLLPLYLEGEVNPGSRAMIVQHLSECQHCAGFLAGAQSARAQLRAEQRQRQAVLRQDQPARQTLSAGQRLLTLFNLLVGYGLIVAATMVLFETMRGMRFLAFETVLGLAVSGALGLSGLSIIALVMRSSAPLRAMRIIALLPFCVVAGLGTLAIDDSPFGLFLWMVGFVGVWLVAAPSATSQAAQPNAAQQPAPPSASPDSANLNLLRTLGGIGLLGAGGLGLLLGVEVGLSYFFNPLSAVLVIIVGLLLWQRRPQQGE